MLRERSQDQSDLARILGLPYTSLKAIILMVMVYHKERIQLETSHRKKCIVQNPRKVPNVELPAVFSPWSQDSFTFPDIHV